MIKKNIYGLLLATLTIITAFLLYFILGYTLEFKFFRYIIVPLSLLFFCYINIIINRKYFIIFILFYIFILALLKILKLETYHYNFFDAGIYVNKLWILSDSFFTNSFLSTLFSGHFQPIILLYAVILKFTSSINLVFILETIFLSSGAIPLYLYSLSIIKNRNTSLLLVLIYLFSPVLLFNDILGFHPDHIVMPLILWCFYFAQQKKPLYLFCCMLLISLAGEQWIPSLISFSIYIFFYGSCKKLSLLFFIFFSCQFIFIYFYLLPFFNSTDIDPLGVTSNANSVYEKLLSFSLDDKASLFADKKKFLFLYQILFQFAFTPILNSKFLLIGFPELLKIIGSSEPLHYAIEGHYTLIIFPIVIISFIDLIPKLISFSSNFFHHKITAYKIVLISFLATLGMSIAHSPLPISLSFWLDISSGDFKYNNYLKDDRFNSFHNINNILSKFSNYNVEISNLAFYPALGRNGFINLFPSKNYFKSDFIIVEKINIKSYGSILNNYNYLSEFNNASLELRNHFHLIYSDDLFELWINNNYEK